MKDLTGQQFGRLTVRKPTVERRNGSVVWECLCSCGRTVLVNGGSLTSGRTNSCGCLRKERTTVLGEGMDKDIAGKRFGRLTAIRATDNRKNGSVVWECRCDCGTVVFESVTELGKIRSCGCLQRDAIQNIGKQNMKDITGQKFGLLTAVRPTEKRKNGTIIWECRCDCGCSKLVQISSLTCGDTKSCGCLKYRKKRKDLIYDGGNL